MELHAFKTITIGAAANGSLLFIEDHWHIKVEIPNEGRYLLNLTGSFDSPLWTAHDDSTDICLTIADDYVWEPDADFPDKKWKKLSHLSVVVTEKGPAIVAEIEGRYKFFLFSGQQIASAKRAEVVFKNFNILIRKATGTSSLLLARVVSQPSK
ncbi:hypothetical protein [Xanthomonas sp. SI]|uniref:hypothetical protein n=1 Tax=Xanthomonas sp. SI TaxID=2724123 RepID=UPI00163B18F2|nr:hypothetical protein [Xanthomonas sp. SI]